MTLTARQLQVLELRAQGFTAAEIARLLWLSPHTVREHANHANEALGARSVAEAVAVAFRRGILA